MAQPEIEVNQITAAPAFDGSAITSVDAITVGGEGISDFHDAAQLTGSLTNARVTSGNVTQHQLALSIGGGQVTSAVSNATEWDGSVKTVSTSPPSGGSDGDIWYQYE